MPKTALPKMNLDPVLPAPDAAIPIPQEGGTYTYDPATNRLTRNTADESPLPAEDQPVNKE